MDRRNFIAGVLGAGILTSPFRAFSQAPLVAADAHSHWGMDAWGGNGALNIGDGLREEMLKAGILLVAMKVIADFPQLSLRGGSTVGQEYAAPGMLHKYFLAMASGVKARAAKDGLMVVGTRADLDSVITQRKPGIVLASEGGDFLEGKLETLEEARAMGLCHLQPVHYRLNELGDISTVEPKHNGLTAFGKDVVRACNRLGILVDVAHCNAAGIQQIIEISTKPVIYSHGWVTVKAPPAYNNNFARAIYIDQAKQVAAKGGVLGIWPVFTKNPEDFAKYLLTVVERLGAEHVAIGTDHSGVPRSALSGYSDFPRVAAALAAGGLKSSEVDAVMGGNYIRVLRQAMDV